MIDFYTCNEHFVIDRGFFERTLVIKLPQRVAGLEGASGTRYPSGMSLETLAQSLGVCETAVGVVWTHGIVPRIRQSFMDQTESWSLRVPARACSRGVPFDGGCGTMQFDADFIHVAIVVVPAPLRVTDCVVLIVLED